MRKKVWFFIIGIALLTEISNAEDDDEMEPKDEESNDNEVLVGDMILSNDQMNFLFTMNSTQRLGLTSPFNKWPNASVFYDMDKSVDQKGREVVIAAMEYIQNVSCVRFKVKDGTTKNYVLIKSGKACSSRVGMRRGIQQMIIDGNSCSKGSIVHELLHALGFLHMHTSNDRDDYIQINWKNIKDDGKLNFKRFAARVSMFNTSYDYSSITHYSSRAFAKDKNEPTIIAKRVAHNMGQRKEMSAGDITRLSRMYHCPNFEASITLNDPTTKEQQQSTQFPNGVTIKRVELNKTKDNTSTTDDLVMAGEKKETTLNPNDTLTNDDDDMLLAKDQIDALYSSNAVKRNGLKSVFHHWPFGIVAFEIDPTFNPEYISTIYESMNYISNRSCIRFAPRTPNNQNYIYITKGPGCSSEVGMRHTGKQLMNMNENLCTRGKVIHELLHSLGLLHMHTANDRDNYIKVNWSNIKEKAVFNFKQFVAHVSMFSTPYDYGSIMHYSPAAFAVDKSIPTLVPLHPENAENMGQREAMSEGDVIRLNRMYNCGPLLTSEPSQQSISMQRAKTPSSSRNLDETSALREIQNVGKRKSKLFGVFIFKDIGEN